VVGVLVEVPVMLLVVNVVNRSQGWYERGEGGCHVLRRYKTFWTLALIE